MRKTEETNGVHIDWDYPAPRNLFDRFVGPGATKGEQWLQSVTPTIAAAVLVVAALVADAGWSIAQYIVAAVLALDMVGGVVTNATGAAKRWYHRPGQGFGRHMGFVLIHVVQIAVVMLVFDMGNWVFVSVGFGYLVGATLVILVAPLYLRRPIALLFLVAGIALSLYLIPSPAFFEWFLPVYYTKLLVSHLLREEPYRPGPGGKARPFQGTTDKPAGRAIERSAGAAP